MPEYTLLLWERPDPAAQVSPAEAQAIIAEYVAWANRLAERGLHLGGSKLTDDGGRHVRPGGERPSVVDGPYAETKEVIAGTFTIRADSYEHAVELCLDNPHLRHGWIEVRQVDAIDD